MKRVLLTNAFIKNYSGSELDTIEVANYFLQNNYEVDIFTLEKGNPLLKEVNKKIRVLTYRDIDKLYSKYDILWSHHFPLVDYLIFKTDIQFDYIHHLCLSFYEAYEQLPIYYKELNLVSAMSIKCRDELVNNNNNNIKNNKEILVFPNYAKQSFFNKNKKIAKEIKKIAIVSNHVPEELLKLKNMIETEIQVDIYGQGYNYVKIDEKILLNYDVIISIGKTCYYSIALGIPTYVYDHFGGDGYITNNNINDSYQHNFSGRAFRKKMSAEELCKDLTDKYHNAVSTISECKKFGIENFCFENNMKKFLNMLYQTPKFKKEKIIEEYPILVSTGRLFVEQVGTCKDIIEDLKNGGIRNCQLFYDTSLGFNERESIKEESKLVDNNTYEVEFELKNDCDRIRFDFCEKDLVVIRDIFMNGKKVNNYSTNNIIEIQGNQISLNNDPSIIIERKFHKDSKIKFRYVLVEKQLSDVHEEYLSERNILIEEINKKHNELSLEKEKNLNLFQENNNLLEELNSIKNSRIYKLIKKILKRK